MKRREPILNKEQSEKINDMFKVALEYHNGQIRNGSGLPYFIHLTDVMKRVTEFGVYDLETILGAIGHDLFEDTTIHEGHLKRDFGGNVVRIIRECSREGGDAVTRQEKIDFLSSFKKKSFQSCIIKLADRMSNVNDYRNDGQIAYSKLYALQAYPLYWHLKDNEENLKSQFGNLVAENILDAICDIEHYIKTIPCPFPEFINYYMDRNSDSLNKLICNKSVRTTFDNKEK